MKTPRIRKTERATDDSYRNNRARVSHKAAVRDLKQQTHENDFWPPYTSTLYGDEMPEHDLYGDDGWPENP